MRAHLSFKKQCILKPITNISFEPLPVTYFLNNKVKINKMYTRGVYQLTCNSCDAKYIGKTSKLD